MRRSTAKVKHWIGDRPALDVAKENGISQGTFYARLHDKWDHERAATEPERGRHGGVRRRPEHVIKHRIGDRPAVDVAREHGISPRLFHGRMQSGQDPLRAATEPFAGARIVFTPEERETMRRAGVREATARGRIERGEDRQKALTTPARTPMTHEEAARMRAAGVSRQLFSLRVTQWDWDREEALTTPPRQKPPPKP